MLPGITVTKFNTANNASSICVLCIYHLSYKGVGNTVSGKSIQLPCKHRSFLKKPTLPPRPANSCVNLTREPQVGKMAVSLQSSDNMWRIDDLRLGPVCSRTWNADERLRHDTSRQAPSHCKLCLICQHTTMNIPVTLTEFEKSYNYQLFDLSCFFLCEQI
jgi:hypothetical protein